MRCATSPCQGNSRLSGSGYPPSGGYALLAGGALRRGFGAATQNFDAGTWVGDNRRVRVAMQACRVECNGGPE